MTKERNMTEEPKKARIHDVGGGEMQLRIRR
jgi:hypothetical protein